MRCPNCDVQVPEGEKFCPQCGVPVEAVRTCPYCGAALLAEEQFCGECGREVGPEAQSTAFMPTATSSPSAKKRSPWLWIIIAVTAVIILGCLGTCIGFALIPTPTPTPTHTPTPAFTATFTPTPSPTPTFTPSPTPTPRLQAGMLLYEEDFTEPGEDWEVEEVGDVEYKLDEGAYSIEVRKENWMAWQSFGEELADFILESDMVLVDGNVYNSGGIFFRYQDKDNFYSLDINGNSKYAVGKEVDGEWSDIIDWTASAAIKGMRQVNHIKLIAYGNSFTLYINGQFVDEFTDTSFNSGQVAVHVTAYDNQPVRVTFDNLKVWDVELR